MKSLEKNGSAAAGAFNDGSEKTCHKCTAELEKLRKLLSRDELTLGLKKYDEECKENKKKELKRKEEQRKKAKRTKTAYKTFCDCGCYCGGIRDDMVYDSCSGKKL